VKQIIIDDEKPRRLVFYLAMEEYLARKEEEAFFIWQSSPTVIFGRNQVLEAEVNVKYCKEHNINIFRRRSGGGCVYSDEGNIMLSYITGNKEVQSAFDEYLQQLVDALCELGIPAERSGRNDVLVQGRKVSGNAFYSAGGNSVVHGTLLFDTNIENMCHSITPNLDKLKSKGVQSVRQRITLLKDWISESDSVNDIVSLKAWLLGWFCSSSRVLTKDEVLEIEAIEQTYLDEDFIYGKDPVHSFVKEGRVEGVGTLCAEITMAKGVVSSIALSGDFFAVKEGLDSKLSAVLKGSRFCREDFEKNIGNFNVNEYIYKLESKNLLDLIFTE
jgi:lipoic acid synthetase/lipoate-protein ligase A